MEIESSQKKEGPIEKFCSDCKTKKTPLWRSGPAGPKSLCNACGIRRRKKRPSFDATTDSNDKNDVKKAKLSNGLKENNMMMGLKSITSPKRIRSIRSPRRWGEVERAALLLMALSCGVVFT